MPEPLADNILLDTRVHNASICCALKEIVLLLFALSRHDQEAEVLVLVHDHTGRIS
jgi:hypothetical protein